MVCPTPNFKVEILRKRLQLQRLMSGRKVIIGRIAVEADAVGVEAGAEADAVGVEAGVGRRVVVL